MKHGLRYTQIYMIWAGIKDRTNPKNHNCKNNYKKFNIKMCDEWKNDFMSFYNWAIVNGYKKEKLSNNKNKWTIDRIDIYGNYEPDNCRWVTNLEQSNNQTTNRKIKYLGITKNLSEWCRELNLRYGTILYRLKLGWGVEKAFSKDTDIQNYYQYNDKKLNINDICNITGLTKTNVWNRLHRGWDIEKIITQRQRRRNKNV